ncbi:membrane hypothetical protein [Verrucomicrobia bacterium]|nr:membrane hypothetical protein [Verrucomicrobiota bacterium]
MRGPALKLLKAGGIAALYAVTALLFCVVADACLWDPFQAHFENDKNPNAWPTFVRYYHFLVQVMTATVAALAARSYGPPRSVGGVLTGTMAALLFRLTEWWGTRIPGRVPQSIWLAVLTACLLGIVFALLGTVSVPRTKAQPNA